jgi:hypothetical protein
MKYLCVPLLIISLITIKNCDTTNPPPPPPDEFTLSASASPAEGGIVNPLSDSYEDGSTVTVTATANEGWDFVDWTGDQTGTANPLVFEIKSNTTVTANFADKRSLYTVNLTAADAEDEISLVFGQSEDEDFVYAPPPPPSGSLDVRFLADGEDYYTLFKSNLLREASWELVYQSGSGDVLTLSWQITGTQMEGALTLTDSEDPSQSDQLEMDMRSESEVQINVNDIERVFIHYSRD